ncbi:MAG TPA: hypothetical protein VE570_04880 [Thermoleophilaceae bacterium]|jgi:CBS domain containing-hemolysin-like protein|nr:hypothetical protein [Thermoleophilaceae bacterium]
MPVPELLLSVALVAANAFFVVAEFSLARVRPTQVAEPPCSSTSESVDPRVSLVGLMLRGAR